MRRRTVWFRSLATLLAAWLPLVAGEPGLLQPCPMHGAERAVIASLRGEAITPGMVGGETSESPAPAHAAHHHGASSVQTDHPAPASDHQHHNCSCIDGCTASAVAFIAPEAATAEFIVASYATVSSIPGVESLARPAPEFSRPYTTGPPRA